MGDFILPSANLLISFYYMLWSPIFYGQAMGFPQIYISKTGKGMNFTNTSWVKTAPDSQLDKSHMRSPDTETL